MPAPITIRPATPADAESLVPLLATLGYPADAETISRRLEALRISDSSGETLLALSGGRAVGFMTLHATPTLHRDTAVGRVTALAVLPEAQGLGVGHRLIAEAESRFRARGLGRIEITSGPTHAAAHPFYRHQGYADQGVRFSKVLT